MQQLRELLQVKEKQTNEKVQKGRGRRTTARIEASTHGYEWTREEKVGKWCTHAQIHTHKVLICDCDCQ